MMQKNLTQQTIRKQKQNDVAYNFIVVKNHFASWTFAKSANVMVEQIKAWKNVNNLQKQMRMLRKELC
jgi:hypothetical protein